ncbi:MAG: hypothetical protein KC649_05980 [Candidatus Omnitrophica bacterium]|nr:hypothetical protein [Candidatus Omnitrophota bacterium]
MMNSIKQLVLQLRFCRFNNKKRNASVLALMFLMIAGTYCFNAAAEEVAYVEEIVILPDGSEQVVRSYRPADKPAGLAHFEVPQSFSEPAPRELRPHEQIELDRLEDDFEQGRITANEYYLRRNAIMNSLKPRSGNQGNGSISYQY